MDFVIALFLLAGFVVYMKVKSRQGIYVENSYWAGLTKPHVVISHHENDSTVMQRKSFAENKIAQFNQYGPKRKGVPVLYYIYSPEFGSYGDWLVKISADIQKEFDQWDKMVGGSKIKMSYYADLHEQEMDN